MPKRAWDPTTSGKALMHLMMRADIKDADLAQACEVSIKTVRTWKAGLEPPQRYTPALSDALQINDEPEAWELLYPKTHAQADRDAERAAAKADLSKRVASMSDADEPIRFRERP